MSRTLIAIWSILGIGLLVLLATGTEGSIAGLESQAFAQLIAFGAIGLAVATGALHRRGVGGTVRGLAVWLAIILALVGCYQYRYELQDIASRITAGLVPGSPLSVTDAEGRISVVIEKASHGHFLTEGSVEGIAVAFLIDTGATSTVLTSQDAGRVGIDVTALAFDIPVSTANGVARAAAAKVRELTIGGIVRRNVPIMVAARGTLEGSLLGMSYISTLSGFDMRGDRLILRD